MTVLVWLGLIALVCGWPFWASFSPYWEDRAYEFPNDNGDFRVRVVESNGQVCAELKQENRHTRSLHKWNSVGRDCAWPAVTGDGWLAGGRSHQILDTSSNTVATPSWLFYGIVPGAATEVRLTLSSGATLKIPTRPADKGGLRVYGHQELNAGDRITVTGVQLRDAGGGEIRVF